ncbi:hypothetical protein K458DRAFT_98706 [Lentithecium fluviatile CBS 122367]|uniref:SCP domain-containing protein n=1 Tax=Lentithecium fluviatile CBS 122367 TaxID=1168545 RepID=A0A6G1JHZ5_9PLEO|nr:hypothetical protein K458DRAFT_98706 [Lentithecium fluviatile CBS 122367]
MKSCGLLKLAAGALFLHSVPSVEYIGAHALPVHGNDAGISDVGPGSHCQGLSLTEPLHGDRLPCPSKQHLLRLTENAPHNAPAQPMDDPIAIAPRRFIMPVRPMPKVPAGGAKPPKPPGGPGKNPGGPGNNNPSGPPALRPGQPANPNQGPTQQPQRLTGDPPPQNSQKEGDKKTDEQKKKDEEEQKKKEEEERKKKEEQEPIEPILAEPVPPPPPTNPGSNDPSRNAPLDPSAGDPANKNPPSDAEVAKQTEKLWKVNNGDGGLVLPNQVMDTMAAVAKLKGIKQEGTWSGGTGVNLEDPTLAGKVQDTIKKHKGDQGGSPASMRDLVPSQAQAHWLSMNPGKQDETFNRMSYAYANFVKGDNFYVITKPGIDVKDQSPGPAGNFGTFELPYLTKADDAGKPKFGAINRIDVQEDGSAVILPEPYWKAGDPQAAPEPQAAWLIDNGNTNPNTNPDPSTNPDSNTNPDPNINPDPNLDDF